MVLPNQGSSTVLPITQDMVIQGRNITAVEIGLIHNLIAEHYYSFTHVLHGVIFCGLAWLAFRKRLRFRWRLAGIHLILFRGSCIYSFAIE